MTEVLALRRPDRCLFRLAQTKQTLRSSAFWRCCKQGAGWSNFLMDDINAHDDAQVGAAARVVHAGCKTALLEHFRISPVRAESEGSTVQVAAGYSPDEYRLLGKISGPAPFSGVLVHHGWKTDAVNLPRVLRSSTHRLPAIAPAEVELR